LQPASSGYDALRFVGAGYMIWLGGSTLLCNGYPREHSATVVESLPARTWSTGFTTGYANGLLSDLCNPKVGIFYIAFLPSFIPTGADAREAALGLGLANAAETYAQMI
jgi:threonine/homoserine/homoserine lactone efflux protein